MICKQAGMIKNLSPFDVNKAKTCEAFCTQVNMKIANTKKGSPYLFSLLE